MFVGFARLIEDLEEGPSQMNGEIEVHRQLKSCL